MRNIRSDSAAEDAGLSVNDEIIGCNGYRVDNETFNAILNGLTAGESMEILFAREDQLFSTQLVMTNYEKPRFEYMVNTKNPETEKLYKFWLGKR